MAAWTHTSYVKRNKVRTHELLLMLQFYIDASTVLQRNLTNVCVCNIVHFKLSICIYKIPTAS